MSRFDSGSDPLRAAPRDLPSILAGEIELPRFDVTDAFQLGVSIHHRINELFPNRPAVINITLSNSQQLLYHSVTAPGVSPDNDEWVRRKRNTVLRWGVSSWYMGRKFDGDQEAFVQKYMLGERGGDYAIHGGGVPIKVKNVAGLVGVVVVSGLKQEEDHMLAVEALRQWAFAHQDH